MLCKLVEVRTVTNNTSNIIKLIKAIILATASFALIIIVFKYAKGFYDEYMDELKGTESYVGVDVVVTIPEGASVKKIAKILKDAGLIEYESAFIKRKENEFEGSLSSGTFTLNTGMTTLEMMEAMAPDDSEPVAVAYLTVPEGFSIDQIAQKCEDNDVCSSQDFINAVNSVTKSEFPYLEDVPAGADVRYRLEGYLFPATYSIYEDTTAESLVQDMLKAFDDYYDDEIRLRADYLGLNSYEVITMASMIEREASVDEERARIAGVYYNRLKEGMLLQVDPTVLYPLTKGLYNKQEVLYEDLELDSPYNTYIYSGLPVGPICNPGLACINAALYPEEHNYYYYHLVDEEEGTHVFTETFEEHLE